ncbi:MAG: hypothetical protein AB1422_13525 [bacterium]
MVYLNCTGRKNVASPGINQKPVLTGSGIGDVVMVKIGGKIKERLVLNFSQIRALEMLRELDKLIFANR